MNVFDQNQIEINKLEVWVNPEQKEQYDENLKDFQDKYEQKLKKILPEELVKKISGSFELSWDIKNSINILKEKWLSEENISRINDFLEYNLEFSEENILDIQEELKNSEWLKNLDLKLWEIIWKAVKEAEKTENEELFDKVFEARKIQQNWDISEKEDILKQLENILNWWENSENNNFDEKQEEKNHETDFVEEPQVEVEEVTVDDADSWNEVWYFEEWLVFGDMFSKDKWWESNDYWNAEVMNQNEVEQNDFSDQNWEFFPILENLKNSWDMTWQQFEKINNDLSWKTSQEKKWIFENFVKNLPNSENKTNILKNFDENKEQITEKNFDKTDFAADIKWKLDLEETVWGLEIMLSENYIQIWNENISEDQNKEQNISASMEIAKTKIIKWKSVDFKNNNSELISEISKEKNLNLKYKKLKELYKEWLKEDAQAGWQKWMEEMEKQKENLISAYKETLQRISEERKNWNEEELKKLIEKKLKLEEESRDTQKFIEELEKVVKETDLDIWQENKKEDE